MYEMGVWKYEMTKQMLDHILQTSVLLKSYTHN